MKRIQHSPEKYLATISQMLDAEGMKEPSAILKQATIKVEETGYDNWNGGTRIWTIFLEIPPTIFALLGTRKHAIEEQISNRLQPIIETFSEDWFNVSFTPKIEPRPEWRENNNDVSYETRRNIVDGFQIDNMFWGGRLNDVEFLERLYDLESLPSYDNRYQDASGDIWQHCVNNNDWELNWVFDDKRFNLMKGPSSEFLNFLCEMVHPVVRPDRNHVLTLVSQFNDQLQHDGWHLVEVEKIAGRPRFVPQQINSATDHSFSRARSVADALDASWMQKEIERLENAVEKDPSLAIGTAKELVETCCKTILDRYNITPPKKADLPKLTKMVTKELKLIPEGIPDEAKGAETIRLLLRNLSVQTQYLSELRGLYGSGHGRSGQHKGLEPRHARLAVGAAVSFIDFISATYHKHKEKAE